MKKVFGCLAILGLMLLSSCKESGTMKVTSSGSIYELLVVMNTNDWEHAAGDTLRAYLEADMPCMPQMESYFSLMQCAPASFDDALKSTRNILVVDVNPNRYTQPKLHFKTDLYAQPQAVAMLTLPDRDSLASVLGQNGQLLQDWFVRQELMRQAKFYRSFCNHDAEALLLNKWGIEMKIPSDYQLIREENDFVWFCNDNGPKRRDIVVYTYPYTDANTFTKDFLCEKRDSMLHRIEAYVEGSYMGTEYKIFPPIFRAISVNNNYCAELRGLWKMKGGAAMGGPFVQHTRVDEINHRVVTAEAFVYAAGQKKRNVYRQAEAVLYTLKLPQERNQLKEVTVGK